jgi:hypothetical protein
MMNEIRSIAMVVGMAMAMRGGWKCDDCGYDASGRADGDAKKSGRVTYEVSEHCDGCGCGDGIGERTVAW